MLHELTKTRHLFGMVSSIVIEAEERIFQLIPQTLLQYHCSGSRARWRAGWKSVDLISYRLPFRGHPCLAVVVILIHDPHQIATHHDLSKHFHVVLQTLKAALQIPLDAGTGL